MEEWKDIPNTNGKMQVSTEGRVRSRRGRNGYELPNGEWRICEQSWHDDGYRKIAVKGKTRLVHELVLTTFVGACPEGMQACHYPDPDPANNNVNNLRWDTQNGNMQDAAKLKRIKGQKLDTEQAMALWEEVKDRPLNKQFLSALTQRYPVSVGTIKDLKSGRVWGWLTNP